MNTDSKISKLSISIIQSFFVIFFITIIIDGVVFLTFKFIEKKQIIKTYKDEAFKHLDYLTEIIHSHFEIAISDLDYLTQTQEVTKWKEQNNKEVIPYIQNNFLVFSKARQSYDQIRLLNTKGQDIVNIVFKNGRAKIADNLINQEDDIQYYFDQLQKAAPSEIYLSPFNLKTVNGSIELPIKPMIRVGIPLYDENNKFKGAILLSFQGAIILNDIKNSSYHEVGSISLLNEKGYWLYSKHPNLNWAFMYPDGNNRSMQFYYPEKWKIISVAPRRQKILKNQLITSVFLCPLSEAHFNIHLKNWILEYTIPFKDMGISNFQILQSFLSQAVIIFPLLMLFSLIFAVVYTQRERYKKAIKHIALYDSLTNIPNRNLLYERIERTIKLSKRYSFSFAIFFIDLDGFKQTNDIFGHKAGDELLKQVGERIIQCLRSSDTVARYGGDEFVVLLSKIKSKTDCEMIAKKVLLTLSEVFNIYSTEIQIGASIGIAIGNEKFKGPIDKIITEADNAMYEAKSNGKNQYIFSN